MLRIMVVHWGTDARVLTPSRVSFFTLVGIGYCLPVVAAFRGGVSDGVGRVRGVLRKARTPFGFSCVLERGEGAIVFHRREQRFDRKVEEMVDRVSFIVRDVIAPQAVDVDARARFPTESLKALADAGFYGLCLPAVSGGMEQGPRTFAAVVEEIAGGCASTAMVYVMHVTAARAIASSNTLVNREDILREISAGRHLTTLAFSEKGSRSQFWAPVSQLEESGDGYITSAWKSWVTAASHADSYVSSARKPGATSPLESVVYLVRRGSPGVRVAARFDGMGLRGNDSAPVVLENYRVGRGDLVSPLGGGANTMLEVVLPWFCVGTAAMAIGLCRAAMAVTAEHVSSTGFEHTGSRLRDLPVLRARLARMSVRTEQARALLGQTLEEMEQGLATAALSVLHARAAAIETAVEVTELAMQTCGGAAYSGYLPVERLFRDARAGWIMAPTMDHLYDFIGRALTGLPPFEENNKV